MKRTIALLLSLTASATCWAGAVPGQITYQGTIKEQGAPVNGPRSMLFRLTNTDGSVEYWSSGNINIDVTQGLFSTVLSPTGIDWQNVIPYIELSVGPQGQPPKVLLPREPITATAYSLISGTVVDGSITAAKLDPSVIPSGTVQLYAGKTPPTVGWLLCDGRSYSQAAFPNLFAAIGTTWGSADAASFNVPDMRGRVPVGAGPGVGLTIRKVADTFGEEAHALSKAEMPSHDHGFLDPGHSHTNQPHHHSYNDPAVGQTRNWSGSSSGYGTSQTGDATIVINNALTNIVFHADGGDASGNTVPHNNMQPSAVLNYIIKI